jgi:hypothetical protein
MNPFAWLRARVRDAVLAGLGDALEQLNNGAPADLADAAARLESRTRPALPAPAENGTAENTVAAGKRGRK